MKYMVSFKPFLIEGLKDHEEQMVGFEEAFGSVTKNSVLVVGCLCEGLPGCCWYCRRSGSWVRREYGVVLVL